MILPGVRSSLSDSFYRQLIFPGQHRNVYLWQQLYKCMSDMHIPYPDIRFSHLLFFIY